MQQNYIYDSIVIGAGISGLVLATRLKARGENYLLLEKSRGVGGRMATRRDKDDVAYDHGAQFYKVQTSKAESAIKLWSSSDAFRLWFEDGDYSYFCAKKGMTNLAKALVDDQRLLLNEKVLSLKEVNNSSQPEVFQLTTETEAIYFTKKIYLTAPLPQSLEILSNSHVEYPAELKNISYAKAIVSLIEVQSEDQPLQEIKYEQNPTENIFSISNKLSKQVSSKLAFTVVMNPAFSDRNYYQLDENILNIVQAEFSDHMLKRSANFKIIKSQLKKWRYSHPLSTYSKKSSRLGPNGNIYLLGDAFGGPSIRGAIDSANSVINDN